MRSKERRTEGGGGERKRGNRGDPWLACGSSIFSTSGWRRLTGRETGKGVGRRNKGLPGYGVLLQILSALRREHAGESGFERVSSFRSTLTHARRLDELIGRISSSYAKPAKVIALLTIPLLTQIADRGERAFARSSTDSSDTGFLRLRHHR